MAEAELTVTELTDILRQSQPRISRHLKLLAEAGLVERLREGAWAFFRLGEHGGSADSRATSSRRLDPADPVLARDRERLAEVRAARGRGRAGLFRSHAAEWDRIRSLHVAEERSRPPSSRRSAGAPFRSLLDLGTGTGRMLELLGPEIERGLGIDLSLDMLALARARLERAGLRHCSVRQGDIYDLPLPRDAFDRRHRAPGAALPRRSARARSARRRACCGRAGGCWWSISRPHDLEFLRDEHAHRRLGFAPETVTQWIDAAGLEMLSAARRCRRSRIPTASSRSRSGSARDPRIALAGALPGRSPDEHRHAAPEPLRACRRDARASASRSSSFRPRPPRWRDAVGGGRPARAARARLRLGHLRGRRLDARAHPRDRQAHSRRDRAEAGRPSHLRRARPAREVDAVVRDYWRPACATSWRCAATRRAASASATRRIRAATAMSADLVAGIKRIGDFEVSVSAYPEKHPESPTVEADIDMLKRQGRCRRDPRHHPVLLR